MFRTLAILRSLQSAHHTLEDVQVSLQKACDYRWLREQLPCGVVTDTNDTLSDGTPALTITLPFLATSARRQGGKWPEAPDERERCHVEGAHACRAAGAPAYRKLESLSHGLVHGALAVLKDAARFDYLLTTNAIRLTWRCLEHIDGPLKSELGRWLDDRDQLAGRHGLFLLEVKIPSATPHVSLHGKWLDTQTDTYRRIVPRHAGP
ncbi:hypothetical protein KG088_12565 [Halomonas sp. TRM85114]|uniref:hypothetical protein n=1 Tax=Halomonas jincaotanensis TaxID=2810616 RepID=UPI001BD25D73|nr:hypothetical protein [Halomonas jincaotanensis]MBS9404465.1 hypothetical protein [Halomonas jincaotanensis]